MINDLIQKKRSRLILSLDVIKQKEFFDILERVAPYIIMVKTHVDIIKDFDNNFIDKIKRMSEDNEFFIFEDRKFADIGNTVRMQYNEGIYKISSWADFVTAHLFPGESIIDGISGKIFLLANMSSVNNLFTKEYSEKVIECAERREEVFGVIGHNYLGKLKNNKLLLVPGVSLYSSGKDNLGQQYISAEEAIMGGADLIIVGRGIYKSENPEKMAKSFSKFF